MSTQPSLTPQWREEVNRRLAAHRNRKGAAPAQQPEPHVAPGSSRAALAAARVAARYAKAPSYSQMQAEEARMAVRAAEIATKVALEAQAAATSALAELHEAAREEPSRGPAVVHNIAQAARAPEPKPAAIPEPAPPEPEVEPAEVQAPVVEAAVPEPAEPVAEAPSYGIRWDPDLPARPKAQARPQLREEFDLAAEDWWNPAEVTENLRNNPIEVPEAEPGHANLIQFPRELVATRKMRPRLAEAQFATATDAEAQLSIFEVDPSTISTEAAAPADMETPRAEWTGMKLDNQPATARARAREAEPEREALPVASMGMRLMAAVVDGTLILASFVTAGFLAAHLYSQPPVGKPAELLGAAALGIIGLLYYAFFFALAVSTPGMKYAGIGLCTFDGRSPTRTRLVLRLAAMVFSLLPVGLGLAWSIFDEDHLSWHDRFSQTYPRKC